MSLYTDLAARYDEIFPFREEAHAFLRRRLGDGAPGAGRRLLDVGCGPGRHAGRLAADGFRVLGIDPDPEMIARASREHPGAAFRRLGMEEIDELAAGPLLDGAFCIGNTLPHLPGADLPRFLARLADLLRPGAAWIVQTVNWDRILAAGGHEFPVRRLAGGGAFVREYRDLSEREVRFLTRLEGADGRVLARGEVRLHPLRAADAERLHRRACLEPVERCGAWDGRPFAAADSPALVLVCRREPER